MTAWLKTLFTWEKFDNNIWEWASYGKIKDYFESRIITTEELKDEEKIIALSVHTKMLSILWEQKWAKES